MMIMKKFKEKLKKIKLIVSDVDGVLTDGKIFLDTRGEEMKVFNARDAFRIEVWLKSGHKMVWFTGRKSAGVIRRAKDLGVDLVFKADLRDGLFNYLKQKYQITPGQVLYVGDDWSDLYYMDNVGVAVTPANGSAENKKVSDTITKAKGGEGVLAEVIELTMRAQGTWDQIVGTYRQKFIL